MRVNPRLKATRAAAGVSLHAMILAELEALEDGADAGPGSGLVGGHGRARGRGNAGDREGDPGDEGGDDVEDACRAGLHHLDYDRRKGWMLRVTVDLGKNVIGKRLKFRLQTRDAGEAEKARDLVLATLKRLGLTVRLRMQGRWRR